MIRRFAIEALAAFVRPFSLRLTSGIYKGARPLVHKFVSAVAYAFLVAIASSAAAYAASAPVLTVESVLSPAWVERADGRREPLAVGMALANKEKVHTGD